MNGKAIAKIWKVSKIAAKSDKRGKQNPIQNLGVKRINQVTCFHISFPSNCEQFEVKYQNLCLFPQTEHYTWLIVAAE